MQSPCSSVTQHIFTFLPSSGVRAGMNRLILAFIFVQQVQTGRLGGEIKTEERLAKERM